MIRLTRWLVVLWLMGWSQAAGAQQRPAFEVASVRVHVVGTPVRVLTRITPERVELVQPLRMVLLRAFEVDAHELVVPDWTDQLFVEVRATIPSGATIEQVPAMLRALLVERFSIVRHTEARATDVYELLVGPGGPKMREVEALDELEAKSVLQDAISPPLPVREAPEGRSRTIQISGGQRHLTSRTRYDVTNDQVANVRTVSAVRMTMAELAAVLRGTLGEPVADRTKLAGVFQFKIDLPRNDDMRLKVAQSLGSAAKLEPTAVSPFKAVETLGLKLERRRAPVDVIVVDSIARVPAEN